MYRPLADLLAHAHIHHMRTLVTTNGTLNDRRHLEPLVGHLDLLAVSLDGPPAEHDQMRARTGAFAAMSERLNALRESGIPFGFLFTLTQFNVHHVQWAVDFALEQGAVLLQIHPLEGSGRALSLLDAVPDAVEGAYALLEVERLRPTVQGRLRLQVDLASRPALAAAALAVEAAGQQTQLPLGQMLSPLVVEPTAAVCRWSTDSRISSRWVMSPVSRCGILPRRGSRSGWPTFIGCVKAFSPN